MAEYTYIVADLLSDATLEELPLNCQSFERKINGGGALRASLNLANPDLRGIDLPALLMSQPRALYVYRDDQIVWTGIIWRGTRGGGDTVDLQAVEMESYLSRRLWSTIGYAPVQVDQLDIARALVLGPATDLRLQVDTQQSGILRDRTTEFAAKDLHTILDLLTNLASVEGGFDFAIDAVDDGEVRTRLLRLGYPRLGRTAVLSELVWESPGNILSWSDDWDALSSATVQFEHGASIGEGDLAAPLTAVARDDVALAAGLPLLEQLGQDHSTVSEQGTLDAYARADLAAARVPVVTHSATVRGDVFPTIGSYAPGDEALYEVTDNWWKAKPDGSPGLSIPLRILAISVDPNTDQVTHSLGPAFSG